ncbi:conserved hypothetical protein [Candidatus Zixiibacteriota bacterium]|nr:conserved hypothetical protein [candidate division Zixibacteria bacterium]
MATKKDIAIGIIIAFSFVIAIGFFGLMLVGAFSAESDFSLSGFGSRIAVVDVVGTITDAEPVVKQIKKWGKSPSIKAIVVHVDSPGGGVAASQEIYDEIKRVREEDGKLVVVSMGSMAASGGYYISCAADKIMADPGTLTGSIGVIIQFYNAGQLLDKIGIQIEKVKSGELKDVGSFDRRMTDRERQMLSAVIMDTYEQFVEVVSQGRNLDKEKVYPLADGSIFTGRQAERLGLVDTLGGFEDAVRYAAQLAGLTGEPHLVKDVKPKAGLLDLLGSASGKIKEVTSGDMGGPRVMYLY